MYYFSEGIKSYKYLLCIINFDWPLSPQEAMDPIKTYIFTTHPFFVTMLKIPERQY